MRTSQFCACTFEEYFCFCPTVFNIRFMTPLKRARIHNEVPYAFSDVSRCLRALIEHRASANVVNHTSKTALHFAAGITAEPRILTRLPKPPRPKHVFEL